MKSTRTMTVAAAAVLTLVLAACGSSSYGHGSTRPPTTGRQPSIGGGGAGAETTVRVASGPHLGDHLVDADGASLYLFAKDKGTKTACVGGCASTWPPLVATGAPAGAEGVTTAELATAKGIDPDQVTYHGHLLYHFAGDAHPGDTNGTSIADWFLVSPDGNPLPVG